MRTYLDENRESLSDGPCQAEQDRIMGRILDRAAKKREAESATQLWNELTASEKRVAEPDAGRMIRGKRAADHLDLIQELRAEVDDARAQHAEDQIRIRVLEERIRELGNMLRADAA